MRQATKLYTVTLMLLLGVLSIQATHAAGLEAYVNRTSISDQDLVRLTLRIDKTGMSDQPDFSSLRRDFQIVAGPNKNSRTQITNGSFSSLTEISLDLSPLRQGTLTIPSLKWGNDRTQPIQILVSPVSAAQKQRMNDTLFFETEVDSKSIYVQQQLLYKVRLFYSTNLAGNFPEAPVLGNTIVNALGKENRYTTMISNRRFNVMEKIYAIYPQESGELILPAEQFIGETDGRGLFSRGQRVSARSDGHRIEVMPKPAAFPGANWLPVKNLNLTAAWSPTPPKFAVGEPVNLQLLITAKNTTASLIPPLPKIDLETARIYVDPAVTNETMDATGTTATRLETLGIVPKKAGPFTIPEVKVQWWSTETNSLQTATIPAVTYTAEPGSQRQVTLVAAPLIDAKTAPIQQPSETIPLYWWAATAGLTLAWLITLLILIQTRRHVSRLEQGEVTSEPVGPSEKQIFAALKAACSNNNTVEIRQQLVAWAQLRWQDQHISKVEDVRRLDEELDTNLANIDQNLYSPDHQPQSTWRGDDLVPILERIRKESSKPGNRKSYLEPLNP